MGFLEEFLYYLSIFALADAIILAGKLLIRFAKSRKEARDAISVLERR